MPRLDLQVPFAGKDEAKRRRPLLNYRGFLGSCRLDQLTIVIYVFKVKADVVG